MCGRNEMNRRHRVILDDLVTRGELNKEGEKTISLDAENGNMYLGGENADGDIRMKNHAGNDTISLNAGNAYMSIGGDGSDGEISIRNKNGDETVKILGSSGDIRLLNADLAEEFEVSPELFGCTTPGTLMSFGPKGLLVQSAREYDTKVVGVVAGAGGYSPAIVMDSNGGKNRIPIAITGKVFCKVEADSVPIEIGDLLTTSERPGYAMKVTDTNRAFGAVIGKALGSLDKQTGLIPVLVSLR